MLLTIASGFWVSNCLRLLESFFSTAPADGDGRPILIDRFGARRPDKRLPLQHESEIKGSFLPDALESQNLVNDRSDTVA